VHAPLRRLLAFLLVAVPASVPGFAGVTWGAAPLQAEGPRPAHDLVLSELPSQRAVEDRAESAVVLVVLDGVRWQDVYEGADRALLGPRAGPSAAPSGPRALLPNLYRLLDAHGVALGAPGHGPEIAATGPQYISLPGYLEIFSGHADSRCLSNFCGRAPGRTLVDDVRESSGGAEVGVVTSWPTIARAAAADPSGVVLTAGRRVTDRADLLRADEPTAALLDQGARASAWPGEDDYRPDALTGRIALRYLVAAHPRFLFVGLGDADELAHRNDYRGYLGALRASDAFIGGLLDALATMGARGRHTTVVVTTDHGRAYGFRDHGPFHPESGRVWLIAGNGDTHGGGLAVASRRHTLSDVAPTVRALLGITGGEGEPIPEIVAR